MNIVKNTSKNILNGKYRSIAFFLLFVFAVEAFVRFLPMERFSGTGIFLANLRGSLADASRPNFDYIIFGESRTLSLMGHAATLQEPWSLYNMSMPAMGSHYYTYYLRKYMRHRKRAPAALIFAGDPGVFEASWNAPIHDPDRIYTDDRNESLFLYFKKRFVRRIEIALGKRKLHTDKLLLREGLWEHFSHRYLHLFSLSESLEQYTGAERVFMFYERFPLVYATYRWREPIAHYVFGFRPSYFQKKKLPLHCTKSCRATWDVSCYPELERLQQNERLARRMERTYGQINLADRKSPTERMQVLALRDRSIAGYLESMEDAAVDLRPLEALARETAKYKIKLVLSFAPAVLDYKEMPYRKRFFAALVPLMQKYSHIYLVPFSHPFLEKKYFVDSAHYLCEGSELVNRDFYQNVLPRIRQIAPPRTATPNSESRIKQATYY